jgi:Short C-terminal domain/Phospholipase_D-nuclease N-terminal
VVTPDIAESAYRSLRRPPAALEISVVKGTHMLANDFGTGQVFLSMLWFVLFFIWIWILITVFADIFRSHDLSGWAKAIWVIFVIFIPYLGVFVYLIARGHKMSEHAMQAAQAQDAAAREYIQSASGTGGSAADELARLADLKEKGVIDDAEFAKLKAKVTG